MATAKKVPMEQKTVISVFKHGPVEQNTIPESYYRENARRLAGPELYLGLELEIENWTGVGGAMIQFRYTEDGSLRNNGRECITYPTKAKFLEELLKDFYSHHRIREENNYSERCSTHVHMNVQDMTFDQLKSLTLLYQTVERLLFDYVGNDRKDNIFCVPWYESSLSASFINKLQKDTNSAVKNWIKYAACNLLPVVSQGTVEFRHLHGTCDVELIMGWVNLLSCLNKYAKENPFANVSKLILDMNTVSNYDRFLTDVFLEWTPLVMKQGYRDLLTTGVVDSKIMLMSPPTKPKLDLPEGTNTRLTGADIERLMQEQRRRARTAAADPITHHFVVQGELHAVAAGDWAWTRGDAPTPADEPSNLEIRESDRRAGFTAHNILDDRRLFGLQDINDMDRMQALEYYQTLDRTIRALAIDWDTEAWVPLREAF